MTLEPKQGHLSSDELADYFLSLLPREREGQVEEHLADCEQCTRLGRQVHAASAVPASWTARAHGEARWRQRVAGALEFLEQGAPHTALQERLARWRDRWSGLAEGAVMLVVETPGRASRIVTEGLEALLRPGSLWQFAPVAATPPTRGPARPDLPGGEDTPVAPIVVAASGKTLVRIALSEDEREVVVRLDRLPAGRAAPLVVLLPDDASQEPQVSELVRQPETDYYIARFSDLPAGQYVAFIEPVEP